MFRKSCPECATTSSTITALQKIFSVEGLPKTIVSDNGPQFTSEEFQTFCKLNTIEHLTSAPFHPASNGLAERFVRTFKQAFSKIMTTETHREKALYKYLATYRSTPNTVSGKSPAELLHGRQSRTILSALFPQKQNVFGSDLKFHVGQEVYARNYSGAKRWVEGQILEVIGQMMYHVQTETGTIKRHQNQLKVKLVIPHTDAYSKSNRSTYDIDIEQDFENQRLHRLPYEPISQNERTFSESTGSASLPNTTTATTSQELTSLVPMRQASSFKRPLESPTVRRSNRKRFKVDRFQAN
ncbi:uncharacterized protein K02A2.6-like [Rhagoletis pomonella]|uniref:uncharacterized protein K02A2.6-like n=1 Tax=Rhagoletis pomonella TaxID=28610 RepID=UPI00177ECC96|nr:uncharacterized protein K02A2.6-like [Rhagoletis pomonella]